MTTRKILTFDDEEGRARRWADRLNSLTPIKNLFEVRPLQIVEFAPMVEELRQRRLDARQTRKPHEAAWDHKLDEAAILIVDYDLLKLNKVTFITGEEIAYLARCYSRCGLIVNLNAYTTRNTFDLTLKGHPESFADLNLGEPQVYNLGLWKEPWKGFRPWAWPILPQALNAYEERVRESYAALDEPVLSFLGLQRVANLLPRSITEFVQSGGPALEKATFRDFVMKSQQGLRRRDKPADDESIARIAAARIHKWLERLVLPGQDVLVDAPHLASRFPSLLKGDPKNKKTWNKAVTLQSDNRSVLKIHLIDEFRFRRENWVSRPCWFWHELSASEEIAEVKDPWETVNRSDVVFCEDISAFSSRKSAREFVADLSSPFARRYVAGVAGVAYQPLVRFAM